MDLQLRQRKHGKILQRVRKPQTCKRTVDLQLRGREHREVLQRMRETETIMYSWSLFVPDFVR